MGFDLFFSINDVPLFFLLLYIYNMDRLGRIAAKGLSKLHLVEETDKDVPLLIKINHFGFLSVDSQDGMRKTGKIPVDMKFYLKLMNQAVRRLERLEITDEKEVKEVFDQVNVYYKQSGGTYKRGPMHTQRAYLQGIMTKRDALALQYFLNQTDKVCMVDRVPLTYSVRSGRPYFPEENPNATVPISTAFPVKTPSNTQNIKQELLDLGITSEHLDKYHVSLKDLLYVYCFDARAGRKAAGKNGLFMDVLKALKNMAVN